MKRVNWACVPEAGSDGVCLARGAALLQLKAEMGEQKLGVDYDVCFEKHPDGGDLVRGWVKAIPLKK